MATDKPLQEIKGMAEKPTYTQLEASFRDSVALYESLLDMSPFPVSISRIEDGRFLVVNARFCKMTGYGMEEVIGRTTSDLGIYADTADRDRMIEAVQQHGEVKRFESRMRNKSGPPIFSQMSMKKIRYKNQNCLLTITTNFSYLSKTQQALRQSENRFQTILNSVTESYYEVDLAGNFTFFNSAALTLLGYSADEMMGMNYSAYTLNDQESEKVFRTFNEVYKTGVPVKFVEYAIQRKDGTVVQVETSTSLQRDSNGRPIGFYGLLRDRTEQKNAEEALRQSEEGYRSLLELAPDAITLGRIRDGRYIQVNTSFCRLSGYTAEEAIGRTDLELNLYVIPEDRRKLHDTMRRNGRVEGLEIQYQTKSGDILDGLVSARQVNFRGQECLLVIVTNITALKKTREALRQSEEKHRNILETMEEGYYEVDVGGHFTFFNQATLKLHGLSPNEVMGMSYKQYLYPDMVKEIRRQFNQMYQTGMPAKVMAYDIIRKDGTARSIEMSAYPLKSGENQIVGFWGITRDRTEQKKAEMALQKNEEQYRLLVDHANDGIYITQNGCVKFHNPKMSKITGYSDQKLADLHFIDLVHPEDKESIYEAHQRKLEAGRNPELFSFRIVNKEQEILWVELSAIGITWDGEPAALNFLRDVTPQKKMETQLLQARKMEAVGTLAGGIAHDFNNLLMGIKGNTALALMDIDKENPLYEKFNNIEHYVKAGAELTQQLLGAGRGGKYETRPTDLNKLVEKSANLFGRTKKEVCIHKEFSNELWTVEVDRSQMEQVLLNLYVNAWHAMPDGGDLYLDTRNVMLDEYYVKPYGVAPGKYVKLGLTDTGVGIDSKDLKRVFDPFFTTKGVGMGTGLGLASAYGIISNHGGIITVYSEKGSGATFNIYLPASGKKVIDRAEQKMEIVKGTETLLFVDDEDGIVEVGLLILQRLGYMVISATNGQEAIEIFRRQKENIDLVIVDMIMPGMSGSDTFNAIRAINPDVKVILSSGYSINGQAKDILDRGCNGFIQKPFSMQALSVKLRQVLDE